MHPEEIQRIEEMTRQGRSIRAIARSLGRNVKTIRRALKRPRRPRPLSPSKLEPFKEIIRELSNQGLLAPRILREIRARGYTGSRTILADHLRTLRGPRKHRQQVFRRFETAPAAEAQVDWSVYRVAMGAATSSVHAFSMILCHSRMLFVRFYRDEKLETLLHAHVEAFAFFEGVARSLVYDNMATVTLGRSSGQVIWNPAFLEFAKHYGYTARLCRPGDPNRKGKIERPFAWIEADFLRASTFDSFDDLNERAHHWLDSVANVRVHPTTKAVPLERFAEEKPLLIRLPQIPYATYRLEVRKVQSDGTVPIDGSFYPAPNCPVGQHVRVRIYPTHVEILDTKGAIAAAHRIPERPMRVAWPHDASSKGPPSLSLSALETRFLARFPQGEPFLDGLKRRMKALAPIHLRRLEQLVGRYGQGRVHAALERAVAYRNFNALAVERVLEAAHPEILAHTPLVPLRTSGAALGALDDIEGGSPGEYRLDGAPASQQTQPPQTTESREGEDHAQEQPIEP
jgi:transposase